MFDGWSVIFTSFSSPASRVVCVVLSVIFTPWIWFESSPIVRSSVSSYIELIVYVDGRSPVFLILRNVTAVCPAVIFRKLFDSPAVAPFESYVAWKHRFVSSTVVLVCSSFSRSVACAILAGISFGLTARVIARVVLCLKLNIAGVTALALMSFESISTSKLLVSDGFVISTGMYCSVLVLSTWMQLFDSSWRNFLLESVIGCVTWAACDENCICSWFRFCEFSGARMQVWIFFSEFGPSSNASCSNLTSKSPWFSALAVTCSGCVPLFCTYRSMHFSCPG